MKRCHFLGWVCLLAFGVGALAADDVPTKFKQKITLAKGIDANTPLKDALDFLADRYELKFVIDKESFAAVEIQQVGEAPVKLEKQTNVPLGTVLQIILDQVKGTYRIEKDRVVIVAKGAAGPAGPVPAEDVSKLVKQLRDSKEDNRLDAALSLAEKGPAARGAVDALIVALKDRSKAVKHQAIKALGAIGPDAKKAVASLLIVVRTDAKEAGNAVDALTKIGEPAAGSLSLLLNAQTYKDVALRKTAAEALAKIGPKLKPPVSTGVVKALVGSAAKDKDVGVRRLAIQALGDIGAEAKSAVPTLVGFLDAKAQKDASIRKGAAAALGKIGLKLEGVSVRAIVQGLLDGTKDSDLNVVKESLKALGSLGPGAKSAITTLLGLFDHQNQDVRIAAIAAVGQIGTESKAVAKAFANLLDDPNPTIVRMTVEAFIKMGKPGVPLLVSALKSDNIFTRIHALRALAKAGTVEAPEVVPFLLTGVNDPNVDVKKLSRQILDKLGKNAGVILAMSLKDKDEMVRLLAARALQKTGSDDKAIVPDLKVGLKDPNEEIRAICAEALSKLGQDAQEATKELLAALGDKSELVRRHAGQALKNVGRKALPELIKMLADKEPTTRAGVAAALGEMGKIAQGALPDLAKLMQDPDKNVREAAVAALEKIGKESVPALMELLKSPEAPTRRMAAQTLSEVGPGAKLALPDLLAALTNDKDAMVRRHAAAALKGLGDAANTKELVAKLIAALKDEDKDVRAQVAMSLGEFGPMAEAAIPHLLAACGDKSDVVPKAAAEALGKIGAAGVPALTTALQDPNPIVRRSAAAAIKDIGPKAKAAVPALALVLRDADLETRQLATQALSEIGAEAKPAEIDLIFVMLHDKDKQVRKFAALALLETKPAVHLSIPAFVQALHDKSVDVTDVAVDSLGKWGPQVVPKLTEALQDKDPQVRRFSADLLSKVGPAAKPAIPILQNLAAKDRDPKVRDAAQKAVKAIGG